MRAIAILEMARVVMASVVRRWMASAAVIIHAATHSRRGIADRSIHPMTATVVRIMQGVLRSFVSLLARVVAFSLVSKAVVRSVLRSVGPSVHHVVVEDSALLKVAPVVGRCIAVEQAGWGVGLASALVVGQHRSSLGIRVRAEDLTAHAVLARRWTSIVDPGCSRLTPIAMATSAGQPRSVAKAQ